MTSVELLLKYLHLTSPEFSTDDNEPALIMAAYARYVGDLMLSNDGAALWKPSLHIEYLLTGNNERLKDLVVFHFLETLWVYLREHGGDPDSIYKWAGPKTGYWLNFLLAVMPVAMRRWPRLVVTT